ncbi:hypothetical protein [Tenacibaculum sp. nBUS_03]|uniref:hypothetical protein n=1 Tax=Tenacibaculum sp. nBUS_03 TaxID=3395320 RepID=UPI003EB99EED
MKVLKLLCVVLVFCVSCSENELEGLDTVERMERGRRVVAIDPIDVTEEVEEEVDKKEKLMYITSYLIGKTLIESEAARDFFYELIKNNELSKIGLNDLLKTKIIDSNPFEVAFQEQFNTYNWHIDPQSGAPNPPKSTSTPDSTKWGGMLDSQMYYQQYLNEILELNKWELYFPNKAVFLDNTQNFSDYLIANKKLICLWNTKYFGLFTDGLILHINGEGNYLPLNFNVSSASSFVIILK